MTGNKQVERNEGNKQERDEVNGEMGDREGLSEEVTLELTLGDKGVSRSKSRRASQTVNGRFRGLRRKGLSIHNIL